MDTYVIKCGKLFDGVNSNIQENAKIIIKGNRIVDVGEELITPQGATEIDLGNMTITPGLIDAHTHPYFMNKTDSMAERLMQTDSWRMIIMLYNARRFLANGITTIRSLGVFRSRTYNDLDVRRAIDEGYMEGPRLVLAAGLATTGSHCDMSSIMRDNPELSSYFENHSAIVGNGPEYFRAEVRRQKKYGYNLIKIVATGGFASTYDSPEDQQFGEDELKMIIDTAHQLGMTVTAHAYSPELIKLLVRLGIDGIEHGAMIDAEAIKMMEDKDVYLVPTFVPYDDIVRVDENSLAQKPQAFRDKLRRYADKITESRELIIGSNLRLGYGSDIVTVYNTYEGGREFSSWIESGIDPFKALKATTSVNAGILGRNDIGIIAPGMLADISGWTGDLLEDKDALLSCGFVMKDGQIYQTAK